jgi:hypothetical protein
MSKAAPTVLASMTAHITCLSPFVLSLHERKEENEEAPSPQDWASAHDQRHGCVLRRRSVQRLILSTPVGGSRLISQEPPSGIPWGPC